MTDEARATGRPRIDRKAYRIVANPFFGVLHDDQLWTDKEWRRQERRREQWRRYARSTRGER